MLLFLDVISPLPEFFVIEDNKVILNAKIIKNESQKLSDNIVETYIKINKDLNLTKNLKKISVTIGPGSFTSLRVGAAFIAGLKARGDLPFYPFSIGDIIMQKINKKNFENIAIFLNSANNQNFLCYIDIDFGINYKKIQDRENIKLNKINTIFYNKNKLNSNLNELDQFKICIIDEFINNIKNINFKKNMFIKPIYISNNELLN